MSIENIPKPHSSKKVDLEKFVRNYTEASYWGKKNQPFQKKWATDTEDVLPNEINAIEKKREISVMGFGGNFNEAYHSCLSKLEERLDKRNWNFVLIGNGTPLKNGANFQYHMSATLYKIDRSKDTKP